MSIEVAQLEQGFIRAESSYNDTTYVSSFTAGDAIKHRRLNIKGSQGRRESPEKSGLPARGQRLPGRPTADWSLAAAWMPSGTLGTPSDIAPVFKAFFGQQVAAGSGSGVTTTVSASPAPTATGFTVASAAGLSVNDCIVVTMPGGQRECTRIKAIATAALTVDALSGAPASGAAVVAGVTYKLQTAVPDSLAILKAYTSGSKQEVATGAVVNQIGVMFSGSEDVTMSASGPCARRRRAGATVPGSMTLAGEPLSSFDGNNYLDGNAFLVTQLKVDGVNGLGLRNLEIGTRYATARQRSDYRGFTVECTFYFEDTRIHDAVDTITRHVVRHVAGNVNGAMCGLVLPRVEWDEPETPDQDTGELMITARGHVDMTSGNDEAFFFEA